MYEGRSEIGHLLEANYTDQDTRGVYALEFLLNPDVSFEKILEMMELKFTQEEHTENLTPVICWILWNSLLRNSMVAFKYYNIRSGANILVGKGEAEDMVRWLKYIAEAVGGRPYSLTSNKSFAEAADDASDVLSYTMQEWIAARKAVSMSTSELSAGTHRLEWVTINFGFNKLSNAVETAINYVTRVNSEWTNNIANDKPVAFVVVFNNTTTKKMHFGGEADNSSYELSWGVISQSLWN